MQARVKELVVCWLGVDRGDDDIAEEGEGAEEEDGEDQISIKFK